MTTTNTMTAKEAYETARASAGSKASTGEFWATLNPNEKKTEFSEKVNQWFKDNNAGLIELCKEQDASPQPYFARISRIKE